MFVPIYLHVIETSDPSRADQFRNFDSQVNGSVFSDAKKMRVNRIHSKNTEEPGYSILYLGPDFRKLNHEAVLINILNVFTKNLPGKGITLYLSYHYEQENGVDRFNRDTASRVMSLHHLCDALSKRDKTIYFGYGGLFEQQELAEECEEADQDEEDETGDGFDPIFGGLLSDVADWDDPDDEDDEEDGYDDDEDEEEDIAGPDRPSVADPFGFLVNPPEMKQSKGGKKSKRKKKDMSDFAYRSAVIKRAKSVKQSIRRYGVVVAAKNSDLKKDRDVIKAFLKVFLPGNKAWQKEFRKQVLKRWMSMYAISKSHLQKMEKAHRKSKKDAAKNNYGAIQKGLSLTAQLMRPADRWNDPSR